MGRMVKKKLKICLISFYDKEEKSKYTIASMRLAGYIQDEDRFDIIIEPVLNDVDEYEIQELANKIEKMDIDVLGMSAYVWTWENIKKISKAIKHKDNMCVMVGGPEVQNRVTSDWYGDEIFSYGEGEAFAKEICIMLSEGKKIDEIRNMENIANARKKGGVFVIDTNGKINCNKPVYTENSIEKLHINDFPSEYGYYETSRGCPYKCGYCGHKFRSRVACFDEKILKEEISYFGKIQMKHLFIVDPILGGLPAGGKKVLKLFQKYAPNVKITSFLRPEYLDDEYLDILRESNIQELRFGIQTININVPQWVRANNISKILKILPQLTETGIPWRAELIVGLPGDDAEGLKNSIRFVLEKVRPTYLHAYHLSVLKETEMYRLLNSKEKEWIKINPESFRAVEAYSYSKDELIYMVNYSVLITSLYNSFAVINEKTGKAGNQAECYKKLDEIVEKHLLKFNKIDLLHYSDGVRYWEKMKIEGL